MSATQPGHSTQVTQARPFRLEVDEEVLQDLRMRLERTYNVQRWAELTGGGQFLTLEEPEALADRLRAFFRPLREDRS